MFKKCFYAKVTAIDSKKNLVKVEAEPFIEDCLIFGVSADDLGDIRPTDEFEITLRRKHRLSEPDDSPVGLYPRMDPEAPLCPDQNQE